ncbi:MFS transporter [Opitutales bacterium ASA1]|uniref:MFS transporter n=1 Tax=Congregicoccus parvus TaxID=3081749 RepID=UPI002B313CCD|nr:MFS transporter [Opitutales bacterium ASA1]
MSDPNQKLSFREKAGYSLSDASANFVFQMFIVFPTAFYVDTVGMSAALMGTMLLFVRFSDAFTDPIMGVIADRTKHRWGRFRPWLLWSAIPFGLMFWVAFTIPAGLSEEGRIWYAIVTYTVLMMAYTMNNVPYASLNGVMTSNSSERTSLSSYRFVAAMAAAFIVQGFTLPLVTKFGDGSNTDPKGWSFTVGIFAAISMIFFVITFFSVKERVQPPAGQKADLKQDFRDVLANRPWLAMFGMVLFVFITLAFRGNANYIFVTRYLEADAMRTFVEQMGLTATAAAMEAPGLGLRILDLFGMVVKPGADPSAVGFSVLNMTGSLVQILGVLSAKPLADRFGKKAVFMVGLFGAAVFQSMHFLVPTDGVWTVFVLTILVNLSYGPTIPLLWAMIADCADWSEWRNHRRSTGFVFAGMVFALKAGLGFGGAIAGWMLAYYGYSAATANDPDVLVGVRHMVSFMSGGLFFVGVLFMFRYPISKRVALQMSDELDQRRQAAAAST